MKHQKELAAVLEFPDCAEKAGRLEAINDLNNDKDQRYHGRIVKDHSDKQKEKWQQQQKS